MSTAPLNGEPDIRDAFFDALCGLAQKDRQIVFLTADMGAKSLERFRQELPGQYINVGVAEQNMVSVAAGLALAGKRAFVYAIAPFATQRCFDQIKVDLSGMGVPVTIVGAGPGIAYHSDGPTHHAVLDVAIMRSLPGMVILNPSDAAMASRAASLCCQSGSPVYVRLDKGKLPPLYSPKDLFSEGLSLIREGRDVLILSTGAMVHKALRVAENLKSRGVEAAVMDVYRLKPVDETLFLQYAERWGKMATLEEHSLAGGLGSIISEILGDHGMTVAVKRFGIRERPLRGHGDREWMHTRYGLDDKTLTERISAWG